jgi:hypothetical protein
LLGDLCRYSHEEGKQEIDTRGTVFAGVIGAISAVVGTLLIVAVVSAGGGVPVMFDPDREVRGWEGAQPT